MCVWPVSPCIVSAWSTDLYPRADPPTTHAAVTGQREFEGTGCILADDMGLGKTLQSIVVLHTLLKNGFKPGERVVKKALVVTPTRWVGKQEAESTCWRVGVRRTAHTLPYTTYYSLIKNWANEIVKWLGDDPDLGVVAVTGACVHVCTCVESILGSI